MKVKLLPFSLCADQLTQTKAAFHSECFRVWKWPLQGKPSFRPLHAGIDPMKVIREGTHLTSSHISQVPWLVMVTAIQTTCLFLIFLQDFVKHWLWNKSDIQICPTCTQAFTNITASKIMLPTLAKLSQRLAPWNIGWRLYLLKTKPYENHPCNVSPSSVLISTQREQLELQTPGLLLNHCVRRGEKKKKNLL